MLLTLAALLPLAPAAPHLEDEVAQPAPEIEWAHGPYAGALRQARTRDRAILAYFFSNGSERCSELYQGTMQDDHVKHAMADYVCYAADVGTDEGRALFDRFGLETVPALIFVTPEDVADDVVLGYIDPGGLVYELARIARGEETISAYERRLAEDGPAPEELDENLVVRKALSDKLEGVGRDSDSRELWISILEMDPDGATYTGARTHFEQVLRDVEEGHVGSEEPLDLAPVYKHLQRKRENAEAALDCWTDLASMEIQRGRAAAGCEALRAAWKIAPEERAADWSRDVAWFLLEWDAMNPDYDTELETPMLSKKERKKAQKFGLELAEALVDRSEEYANEYRAALEEARLASAETAAGDSAEDGDAGMCLAFDSETACDAWLARDLHLLALWQSEAGSRSRATATLRRGLDLDPENEELRATLARFEDEA